MSLITIHPKPDVIFIRKHEKRHHRPYGCTNQHCRKAFGSKSDWKRHESTQHFETETWRCEEHASHSNILECAEIFHEQQEFINHLHQRHRLDEQTISKRCESGRVGNNYQTSYWCGFCRKIILQKDKRGSEAQNERYDHIDDCHFKTGQRIDEWYSIDSQVPRGIRSRKQDEEDSDDTEEDRHSTIPGLPRQPPSSYTPSQISRPGQAPSPCYRQQYQVTKSHVDSTSVVARPRSLDRWYCVSCRSLPIMFSTPKMVVFLEPLDM